MKTLRLSMSLLASALLLSGVLKAANPADTSSAAPKTEQPAQTAPDTTTQVANAATVVAAGTTVANQLGLLDKAKSAGSSLWSMTKTGAGYVATPFVRNEKGQWFGYLEGNKAIAAQMACGIGATAVLGGLGYLGYRLYNGNSTSLSNSNVIKHLPAYITAELDKALVAETIKTEREKLEAVETFKELEPVVKLQKLGEAVINVLKPQTRIGKLEAQIAELIAANEGLKNQKPQIVYVQAKAPAVNYGTACGATNRGGRCVKQR